MEKRDIVIGTGIVCVALAVGISVAVLNSKKEAPAPVEEPPVEVVEEQPPAEPEAPARRQRRSNINLNAGFNNMMPLQQNGQVQRMPTKEEAIQGARDILNAYRNATPQEKQQFAMAMTVTSMVVNGIAQNASSFIGRLSPEQQEQAIQSATQAQELLGAVASELGDSTSQEERAVFGNAFQSLNNLNDSIINPRPAGNMGGGFGGGNFGGGF